MCWPYIILNFLIFLPQTIMNTELWIGIAFLLKINGYYKGISYHCITSYQCKVMLNHCWTSVVSVDNYTYIEVLK